MGGKRVMPMVAVYGTLKKGYWNHCVMEEANGRFISKGITLDKGLLFDIGFPFWLPEFVLTPELKSGKTLKHLVVEVYKVSDMRPLDILEGYPEFYNRFKTKIMLVKQINPKTFQKVRVAYPVWIYVPNNLREDLGRLISEDPEHVIKQAVIVDNKGKTLHKLDLTFWGENI